MSSNCELYLGISDNSAMYRAIMKSCDILLVTLNSSFAHAAFGLRYLFANLGSALQARTKILEFTTDKPVLDIAENLLSYQPKIIGLGVYIWNAPQMLELVSAIKKVSPETCIVLGGPEVSHETSAQTICQMADYTICGEGDFLFKEFCTAYLNRLNLTKSESTLVSDDASSLQSDSLVSSSENAEAILKKKIIRGPLPDIKSIASPYPYYSDFDIQNRTIYVEASRGCPYRCEYCLSSLDKGVRNFDVDLFLQDVQMLIDKGCRQFKFIDRTFNLSVTISTKILQFFLDRIQLGLFLHFEMVPDRLPEELRVLIVQFPAGSLQFEVGIQTLNKEVAKNISRNNDLVKVEENFRFLREKTGVHTHADLIVGLPGENVESFRLGFDQLMELGPDEIQVGILKRLKGTPIARHEKSFQMVYSEKAPYQILQTKDVSFTEMQWMSRFAKYWDLIANSGNFVTCVKKIRQHCLENQISYFDFYYQLTQFFHTRHEKSFGISLLSLTESLYLFLTQYFTEDMCREMIIHDYSTRGKRDIPKFLNTNASRAANRKDATISPNVSPNNPSNIPPNIPPRQRLFLSE